MPFDPHGCPDSSENIFGEPLIYTHGCNEVPGYEWNPSYCIFLDALDVTQNIDATSSKRRDRRICAILLKIHPHTLEAIVSGWLAQLIDPLFLWPSWWPQCVVWYQPDATQFTLRK